MDRGMISRRYAQALLLYAKKRDKEKHIYLETRILSQCYREFPALRRVMGNLMLTTTKKLEIINACAEGGLSHEMKHFVRLLILKKREEFLQEICLSYEALFRKANHWHDVLVITAAPLDKVTKEKIAQKLTSHIHGTVTLHAKVNPALIGGYVILWDTYRLDASLASRLKRIKRRLTDATNN